MSAVNAMNRNSELEELRRKQGYIPWYRRNEFVLGTLAILLIFALFLPQDKPPSTKQWIVIGVFFLLCVAWSGLLFSDEEKPEVVKSLVAFGLLFLVGWLFYRYVDANWERLSHVYFNWRLMGEPMEGGVTAWNILFDGLKLTIKIAFYSALFSTIIGLLLAIFRSFDNRILNAFIIAYIDFFRAMPIIVLMVLIYYALPYTGLTLSAPVSGIVALSLNSSAYVSEIFRAGILSVHHGQIEAAQALGLNAVQTMRLVILPQAFRVVIPPLTSNYVASAKDTAICSSITILELLKSALQVQAWRANPTPIIAATAIYIALFVPLTRLSGVLETKMKVKR
ncbi:MAG TPA: amino acid ABC transporter permease [Chloroflexi bacterium]|nr:amino acid ABC transporter permease [Chloroflexota bacterium]